MQTQRRGDRQHACREMPEPPEASGRVSPSAGQGASLALEAAMFLACAAGPGRLPGDV